jgi:hypothetical protein
MATRRTVTTKMALETIMVFAARWNNVLRADMKNLLNPYYALRWMEITAEKFSGSSSSTVPTDRKPRK